MTSIRPHEAVAAFKSGFSCSQAICSIYGQEFGLDRLTARKISSGFGAGIARSGNICGAVTGAVMVVGLKYGMKRVDDTAAKEKTYRKVTEFIQAFIQRNGSVNCTDLIGYNLANPSQLEEAKEKRVVMTKCPKFVKDASELLDEIL
jgi:C_GCAxxG_C_C family probable redox protein